MELQGISQSTGVGSDLILELKSLVEISSQSKDFFGVEKAQLYVESRLRNLGFETHLILNPNGCSAPCLVAERLGVVDKFITIIGHTDTVNTPERYPFKVDYKLDKVFGAGVADDKGGVVVGINAVENFIYHYPDHYYGIKIVISPNEELGSIGFHHLFKEIGLESKYLLGLEPADYMGRPIHSRNGNRWYHFNIQGRSAHAGRIGEAHVNASHELVRIISALTHFNNDEENTRVNFGSLKSIQDSFNTICGGVSAKMDMRFNSLGKRDLIHYHLLNTIENGYKACQYSGDRPNVFFSIEDDCPPLGVKNNSSLTKLISEIIYKIEKKEISTIHSGGAADINYMANYGNCGLDGLGPVGGNLHTNKEYIELSSLKTRTDVLYNLLEELNNELM